MDVTAAYLGKADGFNQLPQDGMPTVVTAVDGTPGVSVLLQDPPTHTRHSLIKAGDGAKLKKGDTVVTHFSFWTWPAEAGGSPAPVSGGSSWESHQAQNLPMDRLSDTGGLPNGIYDALIGQRVGSQVLVVLTPGDDGFPAGQGLTGNDDDIYIMVFDILGTQK
jgi:peptidylprolyl isomerase